MRRSLLRTPRMGSGKSASPTSVLAGEHPAGDLGAEVLAGDDSQIRAVVLDGSQDRAEGLVAGIRYLQPGSGCLRCSRRRCCVVSPGDRRITGTVSPLRNP